MVGVFAAVLAVLSQISFPLPSGIPVTLQTFAVALCGYALGCKRGTASPCSSIRARRCRSAGVCKLFRRLRFACRSRGAATSTASAMAALCGLGTKMPHRVLAIVLGVAGLAACHLCGTIQFGIISGNGPWAAFLVASVPYLVKDIVSVAAAYGVATALSFALKKSGIHIAA